MPGTIRPLPVVAVPGLLPHSLGNYLASLGLLRVLARAYGVGEEGTKLCWPHVRAAWRDGVFHIVGGPLSLDEILNALDETAVRCEWMRYERGWYEEQRKGTKSKSGLPLARWQASAEETNLELFAAHIVPAARANFNPLLGKGGSAGNRDFSDGWRRVVGLLSTAASGSKEQQRTRHLSDLLSGRPIEWTVSEAALFPAAPAKGQKKGSLNASSWFSEANKLSNSGQQPFRDGTISPWAMVLACEALVFFAGGVSRRLGARARAVGAFPFVVHAAAPTAGGEAGRDVGEVWAPIWGRPMTIAEISALFARGRAEIGGRGALTPSAFAVAISRRGVDAGITEFRRFVLGKTTSANTFEPRFEGIVDVPDRPTASNPASVPAVTVTALERLLGLIESLPRDQKEGTRWRYLGLRGPVEAAMLRVTASPNIAEAVCALLDAAVGALDRVDASRQFRSQNVSWQLLPANWAVELLRLGPDLHPEGRLALALTSSFPAPRPFALYRFGAELRSRERDSRIYHPETAPARWAWHPGLLPRTLTSIIQRYVLDWQQDSQNSGFKSAPLQVAASAADLELWLEGRIDEDLLSRWLSRFALFDWRESSDVGQRFRSLQRVEAPSADLCLYGILHPLFDLRPIYRQTGRPREDFMPPESDARTSANARRITGLLRAGDVARAVEVARSRYAMAHSPLAALDVGLNIGDPERLLASLLFPVSHLDRTKLIERWLRPQRRKMEGDHA